MATYPLDGITLLLRNRNRLSARGKRYVVVGILTKQLKELVRVGRNKLSQLGVSGTKLLENGLQHLGLLLNDLAKLLELGVVSEEIQVAQITTT